MPDPILLSIDAQKAVVALDAITYERVDLAQKVASAAVLLKDKTVAVQELRSKLAEAEKELAEATYNLDLYQSLLDEFQSRYPVPDTAPTNVVVEPAVAEFPETIVSGPLPSEYEPHFQAEVVQDEEEAGPEEVDSEEEPFRASAIKEEKEASQESETVLEKSKENELAEEEE